MRPLLATLTVLLLGGLSIGLYLLKNETQRIERQLVALDRQLIDEEKTIQVLKAEWSYLNRPERLQELAVRHVEYLALRPIAPSQTGDLAQLPRRRMEIEIEAESDGLPRPAHKPLPLKGLLLVGTGQSE
jgi:hypothetical protein